MSYDKAFPDYDNAETFNKMLKALEPYGFGDGSWHNDACPSMGANGGDNGVVVYVDYKDPKLSEYPELRGKTLTEFSVYLESTDETELFDTAEEAIKFAIAKVS